MIFKDANAVYDREIAPSSRYDYCLNCRDPWNFHHNWICPRSSYPFTRARTTLNKNESNNGYWPKEPLQTWARNHYITKAMLNSLNLISIDDYYDYFNVNVLMQTRVSKTTSTVQKMHIESSSQWKISRNLSIKTGECPCGINRQQCNYHK